MLVEMWCMICAIAVIFTLVAVYEKSVIFSIMSILFWLISGITGAYFVEVPYFVSNYNVSSTALTNSSGTILIFSNGVFFMFLGPIFFMVIWMIIQFMDFQDRSKLP